MQAGLHRNVSRSHNGTASGIPGVLRCGWLLLALLLPTVVVASGAADWKVVKQRHFLVYYVSDRCFAEEVGREAERAYRAIMQDLGFTKHHDFWTWDDRVKIFVYPDRRTFQRVTRSPRWARARASYQRKTIGLARDGSDLLTHVLPHELAHLVLRDFLGLTKKAPAWLHEGVAQRQEADGKAAAHRYVRRALQAGQALSLGALTTMDVRHTVSPRMAWSFYAHAASLVSFMIERGGAPAFRVFCGHLRDGKPLEDALRFTYGGAMDSMDGLEQAWQAFVVSGGT